MSLEAIQAAIKELPEMERRKLAPLGSMNWKRRPWDKQIERDFSPGGRGAPLLIELEREIAEG
jgi:hypothetical protein